MEYLIAFLRLVTILIFILSFVLISKAIIKKTSKKSKFIKNGSVLFILGLFLIFIQKIPLLFYKHNINVCNEYLNHWNFSTVSFKRCECKGFIIKYEPAIDADIKDLCLGIITKSFSVNESEVTTKTTPTISITRHKIKTQDETVIIKSPKYLDSVNEFENYEISFPKVSTNSSYILSNDFFQKLIVSDDTYEFTTSISKEGVSNDFKKAPVIEVLTTNQFGNIYKLIIQKNNIIQIIYTTDFSDNCSQWTPKPAGCSSMQIEFSKKLNESQKSYLSASCQTFSIEGVKRCDEIIKKIEIAQIN